MIINFDDFILKVKHIKKLRNRNEMLLELLVKQH